MRSAGRSWPPLLAVASRRCPCRARSSQGDLQRHVALRVPPRSRARSRSTGSGPASEAKAFGKRDQGVQQGSTRTCKVNYKPVGNNVPTVLATAIAGGHPPDMADIAQPGLVKQFADAGPAEADRVTRSRRSRRTSLPSWQQLGTFNGKLYALVFKAANKSLRLVQRARLQDRRRDGAEDAGRSFLKAAKTLQGVGHAGLLDRRRRRLDAHRPVREHLPAHVRGRRSTTPLSAHKIKWTDTSVTTALKTMAQVLGDTSNMAGGTSGALAVRLQRLGHERVRVAAQGRDRASRATSSPA